MKIARNMEAIFVTTLGLALALSQFSSNAVAQAMSEPIQAAMPSKTADSANSTADASARQTIVIHAKRLSH